MPGCGSPSISWLLRAWEPPTRSYLTAKRSFFGRPLESAFTSVSPIPGFHHPQVASVNELSTTPRQHGHRQDESHRKDISEYDRIVYEILATPSGSVTAPVAGAESGEDPPRGGLCSSRCPPETEPRARSAPRQGNKKARSNTCAPTDLSYTSSEPVRASRITKLVSSRNSW